MDFLQITVIWLSVVVTCWTIEERKIQLMKSTSLDGCCDLHYDRYWKFNQEMLFSNRLRINYTFNESVTLLSNYSIVIDPVSLNLEGIYQCICYRFNQVLMTNYSLTVEVDPLLTITTNGSPVSDVIIVEADTSKSIRCQAVGAKPKVNLTWTKNNIILTSHHGNPSVSKHPNGTFDTTITYTIDTSDVEFNITCISSKLATTGQRRKTVTVRTYVIPSTSLTINDVDATNIITLEHKKRLDASCKAVGGRPPSNISWTFNGGQLPLYNHELRTVQSGTTFTSTSNISVVADMVDGQITCLIILGYPDEIVTLQGHYQTYVTPKVYVTVDGERKAEVEPNQPITVECRAVGSRPKVNLQLITNSDELVTRQPLLTSLNKENNETYDTSLSLRLEPIKETGNVTCIVQSLLPLENIYSFATYQVIEKATAANISLVSVLLIILGFGVALLTLITCTLIYIIRSKHASSGISLKGDQDHDSLSVSQLKRRNTGIQFQQEATSLTEMPDVGKDEIRQDNRSSLLQTQRGSSLLCEYLPRPPRLRLPEVPTNSKVAEYSDDLGNEHTYYSAVAETATNGRIFHVNAMRIMLKLKMGLLYNRWMGTIGASNTITKRVQITTISDLTLQRKDIHWDDFVRRLLEMPRNRSIPLVEGICIDTVHLYLLREYLVCDRLEDTLIQIRGRTTAFTEKDGSHLPHKDFVTKTIFGILDGMAAIHSYGFLHQGFCTRKVLLTIPDDCCKIYDFCLAEDASRTTQVKKSQKCYNLNDLPPEALQRNEYSWPSDMWSIAVVIWEIISSGDRPFTSDLESIPNIQSIKKSLPEDYQHLSIETLLQCWNENCALRPTVAELKNVYTENLNAMTTEDTPLLEKREIKDHYVPMKELSLQYETVLQSSPISNITITERSRRFSEESITTK